MFTLGIQPPANPTGERFIHVVGARVHVTDRTELVPGELHYIGELDGAAVWAVDVAGDEDPFDGAAVDLYSYFGRVSEQEWIAAGRAVQIAEWARTHRFCGRCATPNVVQPGERAMRCPACGLLAFPRVAPAMITLVTRGEQALLGRGVQFRGPMYSCLAGFVEPGESLEGAVRREVLEEVGVSVGAVHYWGSQPWPFPHSLMLGFRAEWAAGEIVCDPAEIVDARWFSRDDLPDIPPRISIARKLIDSWLEEPELDT